MQVIRVILADDHKLFRDGIKSLLSDVPDIQVVSEVSNGDDLVLQTGILKPDVAVVDISMPLKSGIDAGKTISSDYPGTGILILSMHTNEEFIIKALKSGAKGYLSKDTTRTELLAAIYAINNGEEYYGKEVSEIIFKYLVKNPDNKCTTVSDLNKLTKRELELVKLISEGYSNKEIADKLFISIRTVDSHKTNIMQKLNMKSAVDLVKFALRNNIINLE